MPIRTLTMSDAEQYVELRRQMLIDAPWAFGSSPGQDRMGSVEAVRAWIASAEGFIVAAWDEREVTPSLLAVAGVMRDPAPKRRHIASIWGVFTRPSARGQGLGRALMTEAIRIAHSWPEVDQVQLSVSEGSSEAHKLYESLGFIAWGRELDGLRVHDRRYDEVHMALSLRGHT